MPSCRSGAEFPGDDAVAEGGPFGGGAAELGDGGPLGVPDGLGAVREVGCLERLRAVLRLPAGRGIDVGQVRACCFSGAGFTPELRAAERRGEVVLVGLERLYGGE